MRKRVIVQSPQRLCGNSVASAGDVDGDGYDDVIVGAYYYDRGQTDEGRAYVFRGSPTGVETTPAWTAESNQASALLGYSVASAGDVDGDGYDDVIVGANHYDNGHVNEGRALVYHGSATGLETRPAWRAESSQVSALFGNAVASAGDVNGDGYDDVIVGAPLYDRGETDEGRAFAFRGSPTGLESSPAWTAEGNQAYAMLGTSLASVGDVNGDGFHDVIVGAYQYDNGHADEGRAFAFLGSVTGLETRPAWNAEGNKTYASFGYSVGTVGDVNGDGYDDMIVGAYGYENGQASEGAAFVFHGRA